MIKRDRACLRNMSKQRLLQEMVQGVTQKADGQSAICAMVIDNKALKVLSSSCKAYDMIEDGIVVWEGLEKNRQALPELDVIYFLSPDKNSVKHLLQDFENEKKPKYRDVHIFFTSNVNQNIPGASSEIDDPIQQIASNKGLVPRIKTLVELNLAFVSYERRVFHLDMPEALPKLYHPYFSERDPDQMTEVVRSIADRLSSLFATFGDIPIIRYHSGQTSGRICESVAQQLHMKVQKFRESPAMTKHQSTIMILERSFDVGPILMNGTNFQSQIYDLLGVGVCSIPEKEKFVDKKNVDMEPTKRKLDDVYSIEGGGEKSKDFILTDSNEIYARVRHRGGDEVGGILRSELAKYLEESKAHKMRSNKDVQAQDMINGLRDLPQYRAMCDHYSALINVATRISNELHTRSLGSYAVLEHRIGSGLDEYGKELKFDQLLDEAQNSYFNDAATPLAQKARLLLLILSFLRGFSDTTRQKLLEPFQKGSPVLYRKISRFLEAGLHQIDSKETVNLFDFGLSNKKEKTKDDTGKITHKIYDDKDKLEKTKKRNKHAATALTYQNEIRTICEDAINDRLSVGSFPYVAQPDGMHHQQNGGGGGNRLHGDATGLKAKNKNWDFSAYGETALNKETEAAAAADYGRKKLFVFIVGGITFPEMKDIYDLSNSSQTDIYLGGTAIYSPMSFLNALDTVPHEWRPTVQPQRAAEE